MNRKKGFIKYYIFSATLFILSIVAFVIILVTVIMSNTNGGNRFIVPGEAKIELEEAGTYIVYHENKSEFEGEIYNQQGQINGLKLEIINNKTDKPIDLSQSTIQSSYAIGNREGYSIYQFDINEPTNILIQGYYEDGEGSFAVLNVDKSNIRGMFMGISAAVFVPMAFGVGTLILLVIGIVKTVSYSKQSNNPVNQ